MSASHSNDRDVAVSVMRIASLNQDDSDQLNANEFQKAFIDTG
ncbi:hypothetical protein [Ferrimicrobium sp.]|nr:hypothetical protein [Ferrimicrobium sp.]